MKISVNDLCHERPFCDERPHHKNMCSFTSMSTFKVRSLKGWSYMSQFALYTKCTSLFNSDAHSTRIVHVYIFIHNSVTITEFTLHKLPLLMAISKFSSSSVKDLLFRFSTILADAIIASFSLNNCFSCFFDQLEENVKNW